MKSEVKPSVIRSRLGLIALFALFFVPIFIAIAMFTSGDWHPGGSVNHGTLVSPVRPAPDFQATLLGEFEGSHAFDNDKLKDFWTYLYVGSGECDQVCADNLVKIRQVRLTQGREMDRLQRVWLLTSAPQPGASQARFDELFKEHRGLAAAVLNEASVVKISQWLKLDPQGPGIAAQRVYLLDPAGNLMMHFAPDAEPKGLMKDIKRLLKYSKSG